MFDVIEMYTDEDDPKILPFSKRLQTHGFHWRHYLRDAGIFARAGEFTTSMVWIIPPRQTILDLEPFLEYISPSQDPEMCETRYHTFCRSKDGKEIRNAGPFLVPLEQLRSGMEKRVVHLDATPTEHIGYRVYVLGKGDVVPHYSDYTWLVPTDCIVEENSYDAMIEPDQVDPSKKYAYGTKAETSVGLLLAGPRLEPHRKPGETIDIIDGGYAPVVAIPPERPVYDAVVLAYHEDHRPSLKTVQDKVNTHTVIDVKGIANAHYRAAEITTTEYIWIIDADCLIDEEFDFRFKVPDFNHPTIFLWASRNNVNGLEYANGGLKLFHRESVLAHRRDQIPYTDFTESLKKFCDFCDSNQVAGTTVIDETPYTAWKSGFREAYKLYWKSKAGDKLSHERLLAWCEIANTPNGEYAVIGANHAVKIATKTSPTKINDYDWLAEEWKKFS